MKLACENKKGTHDICIIATKINVTINITSIKKTTEILYCACEGKKKKGLFHSTFM